ncbi:MAG: hypothetical protein ACRDY0_05820, partial [Acidimicrobiales bacterium]
MKTAQSSKRVGAYVTGALASVVIGWAGPAFACTSSILLQVSPAAMLPGATATVTGQSFEPAGTGSQVSVSMMDAQGNPVAMPVMTASPDANGDFSLSFTVPQEAPGYYLLKATQDDLRTGSITAFTPVRAEMQVSAPPQVAPAPAPSPVAAPAPAPVAVTPTPAPVVATPAPAQPGQPAAVDPAAPAGQAA